jgi:hypothetical protein
MSQLLDPQDILDLHKQYADEFTALAQSGLVAAFSALSNSGIFDYTPAQIAIVWPTLGQPIRVGGPTPPTPMGPLGDPPTLLGMRDIPNPTFGAAPNPMYGNPPVYNAPSKPSGSPPTLTVTPPPMPPTPVMPPPPVYLTLPALTLPYTELELPIPPTIIIPPFEGTKPPPITIPDPEGIIAKYLKEQSDHRNMLPAYMKGNADALIAAYIPEYAELRMRINNAIISYTDKVNGGGMSIPANIQGAIMARHSDRNNLEFSRALDTAIDTIGKRGFTLPPGAMLAVLRQSRMAMGDAQVRGSTEIATKTLELEQNNFQFMLKLGEQLEEKCIDTITQYLQLALKIDELAIMSAKEIVTAYMGAYNLQVMVYKALWDGYAADVAAYKARIEALMMQVTLYEAQIKAELAKVEINKGYVEILQVVAQTNATIAQAYKYQIDAAMAPMEVAKLQVAIYESMVRAYAAQVNAYESMWNAYKAEVEGSLAPFHAYTAQAQAYSAQVAGYTAQVNAYSAQVNAYGETNKSIGQTNESATRSWAMVVEAQIKQFDALVAAYTAESHAAVANGQIEVEYWRTQANIIFQEYNSAMNQTFEYAREQMNLFRGQMEAAINAANGLAHAANVAGSLASGAMTGLSTFAGSLVTAEQ